jgi:hypothetical protein
MLMSSRTAVFRLLLVILALVSASLACNLPFTGTPTPAYEPVPISTKAAGELVDSVKAAIERYQQTGLLELTLDERQLTSMLVFSLQEQADINLVDPQIHLRDDQIILTGGVEQIAGQVAAEIILKPGVDASGQPQLEIVSARLGILPLPAVVLNEVIDAASDLIAQQIAAAGADFRLESITVGEGVLEIRGGKQ